MRYAVLKSLCFLSILLPIICLSGCGEQEEKKTEAIRIGVTLYQQDDTFISTIVQYLEQDVREAELQEGVKINLNITDGLGSMAEQNEQIDRFLALNYDVICVNIVDRTAAAVIVDKAQAAGVPLIFFNRQPVEEDMGLWDQTFYVGGNASQSGTLQGQIVLDAWKADSSSIDRNQDGILQYVMLEGEPGHQDTLLRTESSIKTLANAGVKLEKLANDTANWHRGQASAKMRQWLEEFGGSIEVVFANNDDMALGAIDACLEAGLSVPELPFVVGVDATPPALQAIADGTLQGTVQNAARDQAKAILDLALALSSGSDPHEAVPLSDNQYVWLDYSAVTLENLEEFLSAVPVSSASSSIEASPLSLGFSSGN